MGTRFIEGLAALVLSLVGASTGAAFQRPPLAKEDFAIFERPPRLLLTDRRTRLLRRERERHTMRWQELDLLVTGKAQFEQPGFAYALHYYISGNEAVGRMAVNWALEQRGDASPETLREVALVNDWCQPLLSDEQKDKLAALLTDGVRRYAEPKSAAEARSAAFAAIELADRDPDLSQSTLLRLVTGWWRGQMAPQLNAGKSLLGWREELYALFEFLHAIRDNARIDLDEDAAKFFEKLPAMTLLMYYPAPYPGVENEYRIPVYTGAGGPDLREAALARAADFSLVAYFPNDQYAQFVQGWLIHDRFMMKTSFGAPYEFLWANPYHPGLSYFTMPTTLHFGGNLFLRSGWEDEAQWLGYTSAGIQYFADGKRVPLTRKAGSAPMVLGSSTVLFSQPPIVAATTGEENENIYMVGLQPGKSYEVEVDDEEMREEQADSSGILSFEFRTPREAKIYVREMQPLEARQR